MLATASAKVIGMNVIAKPVDRARVATLPRKQQKAWLEYLERSEKQKAIDKAALAREQKAAGNTNPQHAQLGFGGRGFRASHPAAWWTSDEALAAARNVITWQVADGGWSKNIDMMSRPRAPGNFYDADNENRFPAPADFDKPVDPSWHYIATLDNDATWMQIRFLAHVATALLAAHRDADARPIRASVERGIEYLLHAQYPNGGWPQVWPLEGGYHDAITINDDAMTHAVQILEDVALRAPDYRFLPAAMVKRAGPAAQRGIDCLLELQIEENGVKTAWAQQYDALTLAPASARNYEIPALSSDESYTVAQFLMSLPNPTPAEAAAVHAACAWFAVSDVTIW
jgi:PelA/Pel-15E family pectate lyase